MIRRERYIDQLVRWKDKQVIKVITGVRRSGKSTLLRLFADHLIENGVPESRIVMINLEDLANADLLDYMNLYRHVRARISSEEKTYVFIDEVQNCKGFERAVDSLFLDPHADIYMTGSNAWMLSGELATLLSGRYVTITVLPLSFAEYCDGISGSQRGLREKFIDYLQNGGFPFTAGLDADPDRDTLVREYIEGIYNTILVKDTAVREGIRDISLLERIVRCLASSVGSPVSTKKIADTLISSGRKVSVNTVDAYLRALTESYVFLRCDRMDVRGREYLKTLGKYYMIDTGLKNLLTAGKTRDLGHLLENAVYLELVRRGYRVSVGKLDDREIDFVVNLSEGAGYVQVSASVLDDATLVREITPLHRVHDNYPKLLLTLDDFGSGSSHEGILQLNVMDWMLGNTKAPF